MSRQLENAFGAPASGLSSRAYPSRSAEERFLPFVPKRRKRKEAAPEIWGNEPEDGSREEMK